MSTDLDTTALDTEPEPMPELAEKPEPVPQGGKHPDTDGMPDDQDATDDDTTDTMVDQEPEPESEGHAPTAPPPAADHTALDPEDHSPVAPPPVAMVPDPINGLRQEAKSRSLRSLAQGGVVAVLAQVLLVLYPLTQHLQMGTPFHVDWRAEGLIVGAAAGNALLSYLQKAMGR